MNVVSSVSFSGKDKGRSARKASLPPTGHLPKSERKQYLDIFSKTGSTEKPKPSEREKNASFINIKIDPLVHGKKNKGRLRSESSQLLLPDLLGQGTINLNLDNPHAQLWKIPDHFLSTYGRLPEYKAGSPNWEERVDFKTLHDLPLDIKRNLAIAAMAQSTARHLGSNFRDTAYKFTLLTAVSSHLNIIPDEYKRIIIDRNPNVNI